MHACVKTFKKNYFFSGACSPASYVPPCRVLVNDLVIASSYLEVLGIDISCAVIKVHNGVDLMHTGSEGALRRRVKQLV